MFGTSFAVGLVGINRIKALIMARDRMANVAGVEKNA